MTEQCFLFNFECINPTYSENPYTRRERTVMGCKECEHPQRYFRQNLENGRLSGLQKSILLNCPHRGSPISVKDLKKELGTSENKHEVSVTRAIYSLIEKGLVDTQAFKWRDEPNITLATLFKRLTDGGGPPTKYIKLSEEGIGKVKELNVKKVSSVENLTIRCYFGKGGR